MRKPNKKNNPEKNTYKPRAVSPYPQVFYRSPQALTREISTPDQRDFLENTIRFGEDDNLPLRIAHAVDESPSTKSCVETISQFIKGSGFSNPDVAKIKIDKNGKTLWDLHCSLCDSLALFRGFAANFKYSETGKIKIIYSVSFESCRFVQPPEGSNEITTINYNPYYGTSQYKKEYTKSYPVFEIEAVQKQIASLKPADRKKYPGQIYYFGKTSPLQRFYPVPDYWSAKKWIYIDGRIQEAHAENLDNGFFQSVQMTVIGNPNDWSQNPRLQEEYTDSEGVKRTKSKKTVGEEFSDSMSQVFSGSKKMGSVLVNWAANKENSPTIEEFPTNANADLFLALQDITTKNITIATRVPSILANISEGVSLGSGGSEMQKAVELMQSRTSEYRQILENFYNDVVLPNLDGKAYKGDPISIMNFNPVTVPVELDDKFWNVLNDVEKRAFVKKNFSNIELQDDQPQTDSEGNPLPPGEIQINDNLRSMTGRQQQQLMRIIRQFGQGKINEETAKIQLKGFGFTDEEIIRMLGLDEVDTQTQQPVMQ